MTPPPHTTQTSNIVGTPPSKNPGWFRQWWKIIFLVCCIILLLCMVYFIRRTYFYFQGIQNGTVDLSAFSSEKTTKIQATNQPQTLDQFTINNFADDPVMGAADAPITIVQFADFQCPNSAEVSSIMETIMQKYADSVRFVYRDFPVSEIHVNAAKAAEAAQCANDQGQFWQFRHTLFTNQDHLTIADLKRYAAELNLHTTQFDNCIDSNKYTSEVQADFEDGIRIGVTGTPTFFFNGNKVEGVITEAGFDQIIQYFQSKQ
ncbi:MAG TPA: thioredoxin domain-containing protein [Patescibacteria group bacterium]|nr:thioredoxin domain-containing protein [Patescibacteria group bacterium]